MIAYTRERAYPKVQLSLGKTLYTFRKQMDERKCTALYGTAKNSCLAGKFAK
jgi:hypothetical protein